MLPYFLQEFTSAGGHVEQRRVTDLENITKDFDILVHCTGIGARQLVSDNSVYPIRGQVSRVKIFPFFSQIFLNFSTSR